MTEREALIKRLAFRYNQLRKGNRGALLSVQNILQKELGVYREEFNCFRLKLMLLHNGCSYEEAIEICLQNFDCD